tara:strand:- start:11409 stop:12941 length:1533 start_codon:yes stop_codon:yes gene_type:complete
MYLWVAFCLCTSAFSQDLIYKVKEKLTEKQSRRLASVMNKFEKVDKPRRFKKRHHKASRFAKKLRLKKREFRKTTSVKSQIETLKQTGLFDYIEEDTIEHEIAFQVNDPHADRQWHHSNIETLGAWDFTQGSASVVVAVCDSGVDANHEDLQGVVLPGYNFVDDNSDSSPSTNHGTQVAGLIAAQTNRSGGHGIAPLSKILPLRITNDGNTFLSTIVECIEYAADNGAKVINVSFTGINSNAVQAAGEYAKSKGALLVYAAGNQGRDRGSWPDHQDVLAVGATTEKERRSSFSNYGHFIDIVAPGSNIYTTSPNNRYSSVSGTSFSAPIVSGAAALIYALNTQADPSEVEKFLIQGTRRVGDEFSFGAGLLNINESVRLAFESWQTPPPSQDEPTPNEPTPMTPSLYVEDISLTVFYSWSRARTEANILIKDNLGEAVVGAEVKVDIDGEEVIAITDSNGIAFFQTEQKSRNHRFIYQVLNVSAPGYQYQPDDNLETNANIRARRRFWFF